MMIILGFLNFATAPQIRGLWSAGGEHLWFAAPSVCPPCAARLQSGRLVFCPSAPHLPCPQESHIGLARYGGTDMMSP
jgi:hypothetical protein